MQGHSPQNLAPGVCLLTIGIPTHTHEWGGAFPRLILAKRVSWPIDYLGYVLKQDEINAHAPTNYAILCTTAVSGTCCLHNQCPLLSHLSSSCVLFMCARSLAPCFTRFGYLPSHCTCTHARYKVL